MSAEIPHRTVLGACEIVNFGCRNQLHHLETPRKQFNDQTTPRITTNSSRSAAYKPAHIPKSFPNTDSLFIKDGVRKEARRYRQEAPEEMAQTSVGYVQVCAFGMEKTKGYRQQSSKTV